MDQQVEIYESETESESLIEVDLDYTVVPGSMLAELSQIVTSHSIDGTFESCPRRFEFAHVWKKTSDREKSGFAAEVGTALHEAVQAWARVWLAPGSEQNDRLWIEATNRGLFVLAKWWPWSLETVQKEAGKLIGERTLGNSILLFDKIVASTEWDEWELIDIPGHGLSIEVPWLIIHTSIGPVRTPYGRDAFFSTQGKIDFLLRHRKTGEIRVWDLKTTVKEVKSHDAAFKFSGQGGLYSIILAHALGFDWRKHGLKMTYFVAYFGTLETDMSVEPWTYPYDREDIEDAIAAKLERLSRMAHFARIGHWPRRQHGCDFYGSPCQYLEVCELRNQSLIKDWFSFELDNGAMIDYDRVYAPVWTMQA